MTKLTKKEMLEELDYHLSFHNTMVESLELFKRKLIKLDGDELNTYFRKIMKQIKE